MKRLFLFLLLIAPLPLPAQSSYVRKTVRASGGDYTAATFQRALNDAAAYQDGTACMPYIIEIDAGYTITGPNNGPYAVFTIPAKNCVYAVIVRSSRSGDITQRIDPALHSGMYASIKAPIGQSGPLLQVPENEVTGNWRFEGIEFTTTPPNGEILQFLFIGTLVSSGDVIFPHDITFDRCWIHGAALEPGPKVGAELVGTRINIINSRVEQFQAPYHGGAYEVGDSQAVLLEICYDCLLQNNYFEAATENVFHTVNSTVTDIGNYYHKRPIYKWSTSNGTNTPPSGTCYSDSTSGEYYLNSAEAGMESGTPNWWGTKFISAVSNNGGHYQVSIPAEDYPDQTKVFVTPVGAYPGIWGIWTLDRLAANTYVLHGSTFVQDAYPPMSGEHPGGVTAIYGAYVCVAGTWTPTAESRLQYNVKNLRESKGHDYWQFYGNVLSSTWIQNQWASLLMNAEVIPSPHQRTSIVANYFHDVPVGPNQGQTTWGPNGWFTMHDNLILSGRLGQINQPDVVGHGLSMMDFQSCSPVGFTCSNGQPSINLTDIAVYHNTALTDAPTYDPSTGAGFAAAGGGMFNGTFRQDHNIYTGLGKVHWLDRQIPACNAGTCLGAMTSVTDSTYIQKNTLMQIPGQASETCGVLSGYAPNLLVPPFDCQSAFSSVFTNYRSDGSGDYHVKNTYTFGYRAATDRPGDSGANIDWVTAATAHAVDGALNPYLTAEFKSIVPGSTSATFFYVAPDQAACTVSASTDPRFGSTAFSQADSGGNPSRGMEVTGLTPSTLYYGQIACANYPNAPIPMLGVPQPMFITTP